MKRLQIAGGSVLAFLLVAGHSAIAATPDLSGFWELRYDSRSVPQAELTPAARRAARDNQYRDIDGLRWCRIAGMPLMMDSPLDIRQGKIEVAIVTPMTSIARHLYIDGRKQVDPADFETTVVGNSVAHWDGDDLVVHTVGFSSRGIVSIPGGGYRNPKSELTERYRLLDGGNALSVQFTWTDPSVYPKPHSYEFKYFRLPAATNVLEWRCNPNDEERARFFAPAIESFRK